MFTFTKTKMKTNLKLSYSAFLLLTLLACIALSMVQRTSSKLGPAAQPTIPPSQPTEQTKKQSPPRASDKGNPRRVKATYANPSGILSSSARAATITAKTKEKIITKNGVVYPLRIYSPLLIPNDTYANQWWIGPSSMGGVWDLPPGAHQTKIAIIDTGFALAHQDLVSRWATNTGESSAATQEAPSSRNCTDRGLTINTSCNLIDDDFDGLIDNEIGPTTKQNPSRLNCSDQGISLQKFCNRIDDDGNGYIDDYRGWDFSNYDNSVQAGETNPLGTGTSHGTMVAGVLGATGNNTVGISGVNWHSSILPLQALDDDSYGDSLTVSEAIHYATDQGADVISISLGTSQSDPYIREAVQYATNHGSLVVAASGNDGCNCISYPANYPEVVAVGAVDRNNNPATFNSYGKNLDVLAPGDNLISTYWTPSNGVSSYAGNLAGTSFATPMVSALLGLGRSYQPTASWDEIVGAMLENADRRTLTSANPRSDGLGFGVIRGTQMLGRVTTNNPSQLRYQLGNNMVQGSPNIYQCDGTLPTTLVYRLTKANQQKFATGTLGYYNLASQGWNQNELMYTCIGLPSDTPNSIRAIDLNRELYNLSTKP